MPSRHSLRRNAGLTDDNTGSRTFGHENPAGSAALIAVDERVVHNRLCSLGVKSECHFMDALAAHGFPNGSLICRLTIEQQESSASCTRDFPPAGAVLPQRGAPTHFATTDRIIAIGASTGGTEAIKQVLSRLPADMPGIVIVQHIPKAFSGPFAIRMNASSLLNVCEARDRQPILAGHVYIAPGGQHLLVVRDGARYQCRLSDGDMVNRHRPSVDVLFRSVAQSAGRNSIGVMLTGMGRDGAEGMKEMRDAGAATIAQDENTSVVWGMPGAARQIDAVQSLHPLPQIAERIVELATVPVDSLQRNTQSG